MPPLFPATSHKGKGKEGKWLRNKIIKNEDEEEVKEEEENHEDEEDCDDPDYRFFLDHLTPDASGKSYVLHIDPNIHLRYAAEEAAEEEGVVVVDDEPKPKPKPQPHLKYNNVFNNNKKKKKKEEMDDELEKKKKKKKKKEINNDEMLPSLSPAIESDSTQINFNFDPLDPSLDRDYTNFLRRLKLQRDGSLLLHFDNNVNIRYTKQHEAEAEEEAEAEKSTPTGFVKKEEEGRDNDDELLTKIEEEEEEEEDYNDDDKDKELLAKFEEEDDEDQNEILTKIEEEEEEDDDSEQESYSPPPPPPPGMPLRSSNPDPPPPPPPPPHQTSNASGSLSQVVGLDSPFQARLLKLINRPYDQREYHKLLKSATARKPVVKYKHLKTRDVPYETKELGSSYFDHYPDLHEKFKSANRCQRLMLLRGFFFWLKNLEHQGAYKPWISTP